MLGGVDKLKQRPEIAITPAGKNNRIVVMDAQLLLGFGPRTPDAVATLARAVHPTVKIDVVEAK
jgi:iron complex transport system substrate-binding protein